MQCKEAKERIDELIFETKSNQDKALNDHLAVCENCRKYAEQKIEEAELMQTVRQTEPVLEQPDVLSDEIMQSVLRKASANHKSNKYLIRTIRLLATAVVALLLSLGTEQYIVLSKIQTLETQLGNVATPAHAGQQFVYRTSVMELNALLEKKEQANGWYRIPALLMLNRLKHINFTFADFNRYMDKAGNPTSARSFEYPLSNR